MAISIDLLKDAEAQFLRDQAQFKKLRIGIGRVIAKIKGMKTVIHSTEPPISRITFSLMNRDFYIDHTIEFDKRSKGTSYLTSYEKAKDNDVSRKLAALQMDVAGMVGKVGATKQTWTVDDNCEDIFLHLFGDII